ncbi:MAG: hypothetical protein CL537_13670 [Alcanivoracaceae bacterium]|nr:hypothetical protein [Alcanivoracaceae bacterium]
MRRGWIGLLLLLTACSEPQPEGELLYVAPYTSACIGAGPMDCMRVRHSETENYQLFYNTIEGFQFEQGFRYTLRVAVSEVENPPADGSALRYRLLEVLNREAVGP